MNPELVVKRFFKEVRSGRNIHLASELMSEKVLAHQIQSEHEVTIERSPIDYANHVQEMLNTYGTFTLEVQELFASQQDKVYVRWKQIGTHIGEIDEFQPTGLPVIELASAVYQVKDGKINEYWIQIDRAGIQAQLESNKEKIK
ncbi:polyketide cyclase [Bacillus cereus]|uniref:ester cyclase n=1 Tax=Bacillus cereus TaxID=1396 RepID=UPI000BF2E88F|nr:ester cyclase [Bacillus cereus]PFA20956.1 polyketide cyclase [Bacillus cereus]